MEAKLGGWVILNFLWQWENYITIYKCLKKNPIGNINRIFLESS